MKKVISLLLAAMMIIAMLAACGGNKAPTNTPAPSENPVQSETVPSETPTDAPKKVGFVTFGLGGDFFQMLATAYEQTMTNLGWEAYYADGEFNPETQMKAVENYIAMGVDVLVIWSVAPEAMGGVIDQAMSQGIKVVAFVAETAKFDVLMLSDDAKLAESLNKMAAKWIDETYADAEDGSVPVAVLTCRAAQTGVTQGDVLLKIADYSKKAGKVMEIECADETAITGQTKAENLYTTNPEVKVFLTAHSGLGLGVTKFFTGISSPVKEYADMGVFCVNGDNAIAAMIKDSASDASPMRGMVMTGSVQDTANDLRDMIIAAVEGTVEPGFRQYAATTFVNADSVEEYLTTGSVTSLTEADFE